MAMQVALLNCTVFLRHGVGICEKIAVCVQIAKNPKRTHEVGGLALETRLLLPQFHC